MAEAVGILEVFGLATAFVAADAGCKAANVHLEVFDKNKPANGRLNLPPHHTARGGRNGKRSRQTGGYTAQCVSRTLPECDSRKDYSHGGLSICFGEPENEKPKRYSSVCRQDRRTDRGVGNILQRTVNVRKPFLRTPEPAKELENPRTV